MSMTGIVIESGIDDDVVPIAALVSVAMAVDGCEHITRGSGRVVNVMDDARIIVR
jgi:hypothetical protein